MAAITCQPCWRIHLTSLAEVYHESNSTYGIRWGEVGKHLLQHLTRQFQLALVAELGVLASAVESPNGLFTQIRTPQQGEMKDSPMNAQDDMVARLDSPLLVMVEMPIDALELACPFILLR